MSAARRCLIIAPTFPPSGLPPAHRARLFARHLPSWGWDPIVLTVDPRDREEPQEPTLAHTVADTHVDSVRALPARVTRLVGVGDIALRAMLALARRVVTVANASRVDVVLLVVPPWYGLFLAPWIRRRVHVPVVVDYVDPWDVLGPDTVTGNHIKRRLAAWVAAQCEGPCLASVAGVFAVSDGIIERLRARYPFLRDRPAAAAPYGFEQSDLTLAPQRLATGGASDLLRLVYLGVLSDSQRPVMAALLDGLARLRQQHPHAAERIRLECYGTSYAPDARGTPRVLDLAVARGLTACVSESPARVPYVDALALMAASGANVVLGDLTTYYAASKLLPVLAAGRPTLAILHAATEPAALLRRLGARGLVCYGDANAPTPADAVAAIAARLHDLTCGRLPIVAADFEADEILRTRTAAHMTGELARLLDRVDTAHTREIRAVTRAEVPAATPGEVLVS